MDEAGEEKETKTMKFQATIKDPDMLDDAIREAVDSELEPMKLDDEEREALTEIRCQRAKDACEKFVEYGEYIVVEFDTDAGTATVVPRKGRT